mmetsp:Transcript_5962/g.10803  ORF Transcript_5962/g.10803 Transcript_5962/m.10803 type:complete len:207 (-) Transcript_5962:32-652(-)
MSKQDNESNIPKKDHPLMPPPPACYAEAVDVQGTGLSSLAEAAELLSHTASNENKQLKEPESSIDDPIAAADDDDITPDDVRECWKATVAGDSKTAPSTSVATPKSDSKFNIAKGDRVLRIIDNYRYLGTVLRRCNDKTWDILFDDGDIDQFVHYEKVLEEKRNYALPTTDDQFGDFIGPMFRQERVTSSAVIHHEVPQMSEHSGN